MRCTFRQPAVCCQGLGLRRMKALGLGGWRQGSESRVLMSKPSEIFGGTGLRVLGLRHMGHLEFSGSQIWVVLGVSFWTGTFKSFK